MLQLAAAPFTAGSSIDPEVMIRMLLIGYVITIRSGRPLCEEVHLNLTHDHFDLDPETLVADTAYGTVELDWLDRSLCLVALYTKAR